MISCRSDLFKHLPPSEIVAAIDIYTESLTPAGRSYNVRVFCNNSIYDILANLVMRITGKPWADDNGWSKDTMDGCKDYKNYETGLWFYHFVDGPLEEQQRQDQSEAIAATIIDALASMGIKNKMSSRDTISCYNDPNEIVYHVARFYLTKADVDKLRPI